MLYEPTNIVPSTLTNTGTIDVNDVVSFSWQINGNSAMTGFKIEMFQNNSDSTPVGSALTVTGLTVYGRDTLGNIVQYTYTSPTSQTWAQVFSSMKNGNKYKFKITQYYAGGSIEQTSFSAINAFAKPEVSNLAVADLTDNVLAQSIINATATYAQAQGNNIQSVRWQLYENGTLIDDTGSIQTADLGYEYGGATSGNSYNLVCSVVSEAGQAAENSLTFSVTYATDNYPNNFTAECLCGADGNLLEWELLGSTSIIIEGVANPTSGYSISNNQLTLADGATVTWNTVKDGDNPAEPMNFSAPWTAVWKGDIFAEQGNVIGYTYPRSVLTNSVTRLALNQTSTLALVRGDSATYLYSVNDTTFTKISEFPYSGSSITANNMAFNYNNRVIVVGNIAYFRSQSGTIQKTSTLSIDGEALSSDLNKTVFSPAYGNLFIVTTSNISGTSNRSVYAFYADMNYSTARYLKELPSGDISIVRFSSDGQKLLINRGSTISVYSVNGISIDDENVLTYDIGFTPKDARFSSDGKDIVFLGSFAVERYSIKNGNFALIYRYDYNQGINYGVALAPDLKSFVLTKAVIGGIPGSIICYSINENGLSVVTNENVSGTGTVIFYSAFPDNSVNCFLYGNNYGVKSISPKYIEFSPYGDILKINNGFITVSVNDAIKIKINSQTKTFALPNNISNASIAVFPSQAVVNFFDKNGNQISTNAQNLTYTQPAVTSVALTGEQTCTYFALVDGDGSAFVGDLIKPDFQFSWGSPNYTLDMYANFVNDLNAGTGGGKGFMIYRQEVEILDKSTNANGEIEYTTNALTTQRELVRLASTVPTIKDYGLKSNVAYQYTFYAYDANNAFYGSKTEVVPARQFQRYSLLATKFSQEDGCYHVYKEFQFSCNIADPTVSNNNNPQFMQNFTPYPTRINSSANYASGTLQSLIGFVDKETYNYFDSTALMDELNSLSTADYTLFLKDMKGHIRMVATSAPIQQTTTLKTRQMQVTISLPWTEIGNANEVSIIQLPTDEGWNNDVQILDVRLKVDFDTGELIVTYPYPYYGTKFNYSKSSGTLNTSTPYGITPASVTLDTTASSATSGAVIASVDDKEST